MKQSSSAVRSLQRLVAAAALCAVTTPAASAQWEPSGRIAGALQIDLGEGESDERRFGGALTVDLWSALGPARLGFVTGLGALTRGDDDENRIYAPLGLSVGAGTSGHTVDFTVLARGGIWGGATNQGLRVGAFLGGGASLDLRIDDVLSVAVALDVWVFFREETRVALSPSIGLQWIVGQDAS